MGSIQQIEKVAQSRAVSAEDSAVASQEVFSQSDHPQHCWRVSTVSWLTKRHCHLRYQVLRAFSGKRAICPLPEFCDKCPYFL